MAPTKIDAEAARSAAAEAARRAAAEAARRAAAEAARMAAAEAARKAAAKPIIKPLNDELSSGRASALKARGLRASGGGLAAETLASNAPKLSLAQVLAAQRSGAPVGQPPASTLATEVLGDGQANCLEQAVRAAKPGDRVLLYANQTDPVGHAVVQRPDGSVVDPSAPASRYPSAAAFQAANPGLSRPVSLSDQQAERVLATPPGAERNAVIHQLGLDPIANRKVAGFPNPLDNPVTDFVEDRVDDVQDAGEDLVDEVQDAGAALIDEAREHGADLLEGVAHITGGGLAAFGGTVDGFVDAVVPADVQDALDALPAPLSGPAAILHAGETIEDLGNTIHDLPEFADAIAQAATYRAQIRGLGEGDSLTVGADGNLAIEGIIGTASGEVKMERTDDGKFKLTVSGEIGAGVGGPLANGVDGSATLTEGGSMEFTFDSADEAVRGMDIMMATAASAATGVLGAVADRTGLTDRIFGADSGDVDELFAQRSAVTLSGGGALAGALTGQAGISAELAASATRGVRLEFGDDGNVDRVVLESVLSASASGSVAGGPAGVNAGVNGSVTVEQGFDIESGTSLAELIRHPSRASPEDDAQITFNAEAHGGATVGAAGGGASAQLNANEGVEASASFRGNPADILNSGALGQLFEGDFDGALDELNDAGLEIDLSVRRYTSVGAEADIEVGSAGTGGGGGISVEHRDYADEALFETSGSVDDVREDLGELIDDVREEAAGIRQDLRFLTPLFA